MRELLVCLMLVAACGGDDAAVISHGPDASGIDAIPGPFDGGRWSLEWTCSSGCPTNPGLFQYLTASGMTLVYSNEGGNSRTDTGTRVEGDCMDVDGAQNGATLRNAYRLCLIDGALVGSITWEIGATLTTWDLMGTR